MVAAENGALPGGKVGGVGDVIRDLPHTLAGRGWAPVVLTPAYSMFNTLPDARRLYAFDVSFAGEMHTAALWKVPAADTRITHLSVEHPLLSPAGPAKVYCDDGADRPFATDAGKFAFFCAAVAAYLRHADSLPDVIHLHDWHTALYLVLRAYDPALQSLQKIRTVYTIHNLAFQGIRPFAADASSLAAWFPALTAPQQELADPRYSNCINPMAAAIRLADKINTVSPTYAREILLPSDPAHGFSGGEGLEADLSRAAAEGRLTGILNGCEYPVMSRRRPGWSSLLQILNEALAAWPASAMQAVSSERLAGLPKRRPRTVLVSIGRLTAQKAALFMQVTAAGITALEAILDKLGSGGVFIMLGSGDPSLEQRFSHICAGRKNFLYLQGYSDALSQVLYRAGDLFLMPSSFEPCGISQMLAMRAGQPCVAHAVGGLKDTIKDGVTGFLFGGDTPQEQADNFVQAVVRACVLKTAAPDRWKAMRTQAALERFSWDVAVEQYEKELYETD